LGEEFCFQIKKTSNFATLLQILNNGFTYRQFISACLIALYAFIITPSLCWHQHEKTSFSSSPKQFKDSGTSYVEEDRDSYCQVCSHHYSYYSNDAVAFQIKAVSLTRLLVEVPALQFYSVTRCYPAERGPPVLA
jgi:hypothetical protein